MEDNVNKKDISQEDAERLLFWIEKIENGLEDLNLEMKIYRRDLQNELDKSKLKNTLQRIVNIKDN